MINGSLCKKFGSKRQNRQNNVNTQKTELVSNLQEEFLGCTMRSAELQGPRWVASLIDHFLEVQDTLQRVDSSGSLALQLLNNSEFLPTSWTAEPTVSGKYDRLCRADSWGNKLTKHAKIEKSNLLQGLLLFIWIN